MTSLEEILNWGIPTLLILIAVGFIYTKFIGPWVMPMLAKIWDSINGTNQESSNNPRMKEISYEM
jgi:hypothetical protein